MRSHSAGILLYRFRDRQLQVLLLHPGGPYWENQDQWSIPKGLPEAGETALQTAQREFAEETGFPVTGECIPLGEAPQPGGKIVHAWACEGELDAGHIQSNLFPMEWPRHSGIIREFPEMDKGDWFSVEAAREKIFKGQTVFLDRLLAYLRSGCFNNIN